MFSFTKKFSKPDQRASRTIAIKPEVRGIKQLDDGIDDTFVSIALAGSFLRFDRFSGCWMEKSQCASGMKLQSIRKYGRYHRPIARPILFWLNRYGGKSHGDCIPPTKPATKESHDTMNAPAKPAQIRVTRRSPAYWRVTIDNPPINVMGPEMVKQFQEVINALEADEQVRVVVFDSAVDDYFLNHSDFTAKLEDLTSMPAGPTGLPPWPDFLVRLTRLPVASIALIRGRATGNGSEITLACDMSFASREKAIISQWEVGVGMVAGGGPMARLPQLIGRNRALEVLLSSEDIRADQAEAYGYVNRALPDADLDAFVEALATRIAKFDKWAIANTKRLVNTSLPPDVELGAGWDACIASLGRPAAQDGIKALMARGFHKPGDVENRLGYYLGQIAR